MASWSPGGDGADIVSVRLLLEPLRVEHAAELAPLLDDARLHRFTGGRPATLPELRSRYARQVAGHSPDGRQRWHNWIVRRRTDGAAAGYVQATVSSSREPIADATPDPTTELTAELAWTIAVPFQERGYAREAAGAMLGWLRAQGVRRFIAHIHPDHHASAAVARGIGLVATDEVRGGEIRWIAAPERKTAIRRPGRGGG